MLSNGMMESNSSDVSFSDVSAEAFLVMLQFMYSGELMVDLVEVSSLIIPLLLLADQFSIMPLQRECCRCILEYLTEVQTEGTVLALIGSIFLFILFLYNLYLSLFISNAMSIWQEVEEQKGKLLMHFS